MQPVLLTIHVLASFVLIIIVLIQSGRSGGFTNLMGGGGADALFSTSSQQSGLRNITLIVAGVFLATSLGLTILARSGATQSVFQRQMQMPPVPPVSAPAAAQPASGVPQVPGDRK